MQTTTTDPVTTARTAICEARARYISAQALLDVFRKDLERAHPSPPEDCDEATFDAWNERYENAYEARGGYRLEKTMIATRRALIATGCDQLAALCPSRAGDMAIIKGAALGQGRRYSWRAETRGLELILRLDTSTLGAIVE